MSAASAGALLDIATSAATLAGDHVARSFRSRSATREKSSFHDLVTAADREAEEIILDEIFRRCPDSTVVAEEGGRRGDGRVHWYVDPIDGTNNFARGIPFFCVSIGVAVDDVLLAATIYDPVRCELLTASDSGAFLNGEPIRASGVCDDAAALLLTDFPHPSRTARREDYDMYAELVSAFGTVRRLGSCALSLAYVACGRADVALATNANAWDGAAGALLVERAGGRFLAGSGAGEPGWKGPQFVAACREFDVLRSRLAAFLDAARV